MSDNDNTIVLTTDDKSAMALVSTIKAAVNGAGKYDGYLFDHPTCNRETVKDHAYALAVLAYPNEKPVQKKDGKRTKFGNAVQAAGNGLRAALGKDESEDGETPVQALLTKAGFAATMDEVIAAWKSAQV